MSGTDSEGTATPEQAAGGEVFADTVPQRYFDRIYAGDPDPWRFETSGYERDKYRATIAALPRARYVCALEVGCSVGVLTLELAARCDALLAVDIAEAALAEARRRCAACGHIAFRRMTVPAELPEGGFDLILLSEVGYYWGAPDLARFLDFCAARLVPGGTLALVHWVLAAGDYPLTGDEVHDRAAATPGLHLVHDDRPLPYRLSILGRD